MCDKCGMRRVTHSTPTTIAGVDGCGPNWLAIAQEPGRRHYVARVLETEELAAQTWDLIAIDIPIGLPDCGPREADRAARKLVEIRRSSVFPSPIRPALSAETWREGHAITCAHNGKGISRQTFAILRKVREMDHYVRSTNLRDRIFEVHPEVSFAAWNQGPMQYQKGDRKDHEERRTLIARYFGENAFDSVKEQVRGEKVAADDIADAFAALWSANRILIGAADRLPAAPQYDSLGLPKHIWY